MKNIYIIFVIIHIALCFDPFNLYLVSQDQGASCLDGTAPGYYYQPAFDGGEQKFLISFMGGGFCQGETTLQVLEECYKRQSTILGSSSQWPSTLDPATVNMMGYLSPVKQNNNFYNWNKVIIQYCDGAFHQGYNKDADYLGHKLFFRGENNTKTIFNEIMIKWGMKNATDVILSGMSAGGVATYYWADYLGELLGNKVKYAAVPDSGFIINVPNYKTKKYVLKTQFENLYRVANKDTLPPNINSLYDYWILANAVGLTCVDKFFSLASCDKTELFAALNLNQLYIDNLALAMTEKPNRGVWAISCVFHVLLGNLITYESKYYQIPENSQNTPNKVLFEWYQNNFTQLITVDQGPWPTNQPCAALPVLEN